VAGGGENCESGEKRKSVKAHRNGGGENNGFNHRRGGGGSESSVSKKRKNCGMASAPS